MTSLPLGFPARRRPAVACVCLLGLAVIAGCAAWDGSATPQTEAGSVATPTTIAFPANATASPAPATSTLDAMIQYVLRGRHPNAATRTAIPTATPAPYYTPSPKPTGTRAPTRTPTPTPTRTPTVDFAAFANAWKTFGDETQQFTFEYPAVYDEPPYADWCRPSSDEYGIRIGQRSELSPVSSEGLSLEQYVDGFFQDCVCSHDDIENGLCDCYIESRQTSTVDGLLAVRVDYRFGGMGRFGTTTMLEYQGLIYRFGLTAGSTCDVPEIALTEGGAYAHMIESFHLVR